MVDATCLIKRDSTGPWNTVSPRKFDLFDRFLDIVKGKWSPGL
jgi:hypothetical protein